MVKFRVFWGKSMYYPSQDDTQFFVNADGEVWYDTDDAWYPTLSKAHDAVLMSWTGLKDLNDTDIYEGDVVMYGDVRYVVVLYQGGFKIECGDVVLDIMLDYEVIGNIYEGE